MQKQGILRRNMWFWFMPHFQGAKRAELTACQGQPKKERENHIRRKQWLLLKMNNLLWTMVHSFEKAICHARGNRQELWKLLLCKKKALIKALQAEPHKRINHEGHWETRERCHIYANYQGVGVWLTQSPGSPSWVSPGICITRVLSKNQSKTPWHSKSELIKLCVDVWN